MKLECNDLQDTLSHLLQVQVQVTKRRDDTLMIDAPFTYPDGDRYPVYVEPLPSAGIRLTDRGHTFMHLSYENDVDAFRKGTRGRLLRQIVDELQISEDDGEIYVDTSMDGLVDALFRLSQGLTKVYDLVYLNRSRVSSTFYEDLFTVLKEIVAEEKLAIDYVEKGMEKAEDYPIDYAIKGKANEPLFLFGVPHRDKARITTITLERLLRHGVKFDSFLIFADQQEIPRKDLARLTNVGGEMVASLDVREDLERKLLRKIA